MNWKIEKINNDHLKLYQIENFIDPIICDQIIELANNEKYWFNFNSEGKKTVYFPNPPKLIQDIDTQLHRILSIPWNHGEVSQVQMYSKGIKIDSHYDFFNPLLPEGRDSLLKSGQRTWTALLYLNDVEQGGETHFIVPNIKIKPKKGKLIFWNNLDDNHQPNYNTIHTGLAVNNGEKYILTKWFRQQPIRYVI